MICACENGITCTYCLAQGLGHFGQDPLPRFVCQACGEENKPQGETELYCLDCESEYAEEFFRPAEPAPVAGSVLLTPSGPVDVEIPAVGRRIYRLNI